MANVTFLHPQSGLRRFLGRYPRASDIRSCTIEPTSSTHGLGQGKRLCFQCLRLSANVTQEQRDYSLEIRVSVEICDTLNIETLEKAVREPFKGFSSSPRLKTIPQGLHECCFFCCRLATWKLGNQEENHSESLRSSTLQCQSRLHRIWPDNNRPLPDWVLGESSTWNLIMTMISEAFAIVVPLVNGSNGILSSANHSSHQSSLLHPGTGRLAHSPV
ncbi:hypothetical protein BJX65DRAFT_169359 [Aspergillus insuetus]